MPREAEISQNERDFILQALGENIRVDGRSLEDIRSLEITLGDEYGVADVRLGKTRVQARITAEITQPFPDRKFDGIFTITTELSPMASPAFETGRPTETETVLSRLLEKSIRRSNAVDTESLCILAGSKVWSLRADVHVLDHDGGLLDASCVAIITALRTFRHLDVSVQGETVIVYTANERAPVPLSLLHHPFCVTVSLFAQGEVLAVDATTSESRVAEGEVVVTANGGGEVCQVAKLGGIPVEAMLLLKCIEMAVEKAKEMGKAVDEAVKKEEGRRDKGLMGELSAENER